MIIIIVYWICVQHSTDKRPQPSVVMLRSGRTDSHKLGQYFPSCNWNPCNASLTWASVVVFSKCFTHAHSTVLDAFHNWM